MPALQNTEEYGRGVLLHIFPSLISVARVHSELHLCSSNQCDTARLESKCTSIQIMLISSHEIVHSVSNKAHCLLYQKQHYKMMMLVWERRSVPHCSLGYSLVIPLSFLPLSQLSKLHILVLLSFSVDTAHLCTSSWWKFTMTSFYRPISNSQLHLTTAAAYVSVASTTVFTPQSAALRLLLIKVEYSTSSTFFGDVSTAFNSVANFILIGEGILTSSRTFVS